MFGEINTLLVDTSTGDDFLTLNGKAVWSVKNRLEMEGLQKLAKVFNSEIKIVTGKPGKADSGREEVVGLGSEVREAGLLYAHLTKRRFRLAESADEVIGGEIPAVLVTKTQSINGELLEFLYKRRAGIKSVPGLIFSDNQEDLRKQVLLRSAAAHLSGSLDSIRIEFHPSLDFNYKKFASYEFFGGAAPVGDVRSALGRGSGLLVVSTHSDGFDAYLGKNLTLCPITNTKIKSGISADLVCQSTRFCHRQQMPVPEFLSSDKLLLPEDISARILIMSICYGLRFQSGIVDTQWSLAQRFADSNGLGAIITTWEIAITNADQNETLSQDISEGMPIGEALARFNKSPEAKKFGRYRLCLIGDPRLKLPTAHLDWTIFHKMIAQRKGNKKTDLINILSDLAPSRAEFFDVCMSYLVNRVHNEHTLSLVKNALTKIAAFNESVQKRSAKAETELRRREMQESVLNYLVNQHGEFHPSWMPLGDKYSTGKVAEKCWICHQPLNVTNINIKFFRTFRRKLAKCPNCGIIRDSPAQLGLELSLNDRTLKFEHGLPPDKSTAKVLILTSNILAENKVWDWETDENGKLKPEFEIPEFSSPSFVTIYVVAAWSESYTVLKILTRAFQNNPEA
ncbi:MAG: hypothetical protein LUM44_22675 [Pyrinomonadaceae bacterium]|nr:hypothetical protein [Pyrinomonadaceae bacterium]